MIIGNKIILRHKTLDEARRDYRWQSDAELMAFSGYPRLEESFSQYLTHCLNSYKKQPSRELFAIKTLPEMEHIGNCAVYSVDHSKNEAQIGILIGERKYWDLGYGTDAVKTLVDYVFRDMGPAPHLPAHAPGQPESPALFREVRLQTLRHSDARWVQFYTYGIAALTSPTKIKKIPPDLPFSKGGMPPGLPAMS